MIPALELSNLHCAVRDHWTFRQRDLLHGINLTVMQGESFGFLGHNGAGKTTTMKCILGLLRHAKGEIRILGEDNRSPHARASVGYLAEQPYFYDHLTVQETMELYSTLAGVPRAERNQRIAATLDQVKISARAKSPMRSLSKGLTQRVALAQAIIARPKLLLLDEPFSGLDPIGRKEFRDLFATLKREGTTIFISSHILSDVEFLCDRVSIMARGAIKGVFTVGDIPRLSAGHYEITVLTSEGAMKTLERFAIETVHLERLIRFKIADRTTAEQALKCALDAQLHVESFAFEQGSLEELFVSLVSFDEGGR